MPRRRRLFDILSLSILYFLIPTPCSGISSPADTDTSNSTFYVECTNATTFQCLKEEKCIALSSKCDGVLDCEDGSDETQCHLKCAEDWFQCADGHCIHSSWRCDGHFDCMGGDGSDEHDCPEDKVVPPPSFCGPNEFRCSDGLCILKTWTCDGEPDCYVTNADGVAEDEASGLCGGETPPVECPEYKCDNGQCILHGWVCDGERDCGDGSDEGEDKCGTERNGTDSCDLKFGAFPCHDGSRCLSPEHVCDGVKQCSDGSDEGTWCQSEDESSCSDLQCDTGCINTPDGPRCYCNHGYQLDLDSFKCVDVNECQQFGVCSQDCTNTDGSFTCSCKKGYEKDVNGSCITSRGEPVLMFSAITEIRAISVRSLIYTPIDFHLPHAVGVGFDHLDTRVYWTDAAGGKETIMSKKLQSSTKTEALVVNGLDMPEQIAVDEYNKNLYFTESHLKLIGVCSINGTGCSVLVSGLDKPRGIAIHHKSRHIFYSDWGAKPAVVRMTLDGGNKKNLVETDLQWPNGLAVDQVMDRIYWADSKLDVIETVKIDGSDRRTILTTHTIHPFSLAVFEDTLYWSDWETREIVSCNKFNGKNYKVLVKEAGIRPMGIVIAHPVSVEEELPVPCAQHECSHVCLPQPLPNHSYKCACPTDMILDSTKKTCVSNPQSSILMVASKSSLYLTNPRVIGNMNISTVTSISPSRVKHVSSLSQGDTVFLSTFNDHFGNIIAVNTTTGHSKRLITSEKIGSITYDPYTGNLFWVDIQKSAVSITSTKTGKTMELLISIDVPQNILFVPEKNRLVIAHTDSVVIVYLPDKSVSHVSYPGLGHVSSMVYSAVQESVFIGDVVEKKILQLDMNSHKITPFMVKLNQGVVSLAVEDEILYWIEEHGSNLLWVEAGSTKDVSWQDLGSVAGRDDKIQVVAFKPSPKTVNSACNAAKCTHICYNQDYAGYTCKCPFGMALDLDNTTCISTCADDATVFHCGEGNCIPKTWVCDGTPDCEDSSDELNCSRDAKAAISPLESSSTTRTTIPTTTITTQTDAVRSSTSTVSTTSPSSTTTNVHRITSRPSTTSSVTASTTTAAPSTISPITTTTVSEVVSKVSDGSDARSNSVKARVNSSPTSKVKKNGGAIALAVILAFLAFAICSILYFKCKRNAKHDFQLSFTNSSFNRSPAPGTVVPRIEQPDQELSTVTIHKRGNTTGYDNPGFDSPWARSGPRLSTLEWPDSPAIDCRDSIVCEGSSTPTNRQKTFKPLDADSAYEPSYDPSIAATSYNDRHFSVDDDEDSPFSYKDDKRKLL